ncbi:hypothetical protein [Mesorhizobium sp. KR2-14]|uniref:hypothetical protein n=1 Tax=Mesorhizobium sp. KR2-14 TaxID=3156610 RepID=UPI0032B5F816
MQRVAKQARTFGAVEDGDTTSAAHSYLHKVFSKTTSLFLATKIRQADSEADGLEAFDMLAGWQGSRGRRRNK